MIPLKDDVPSRAFPFVTVMLIALNVLAYFYQASLDFDARGAGAAEAFIMEFGLVPCRLTGSCPLPGDFPSPTLTIFTFLARWDDFVWPLLVIHKSDMYTVPLGLTYFQSEYLAFWNEQMAASLVALVPTFTLFLCFQRYFVRGVVLTGLKG